MVRAPSNRRRIPFAGPSVSITRPGASNIHALRVVWKRTPGARADVRVAVAQASELRGTEAPAAITRGVPLTAGWTTRSRKSAAAAL